MSLRKNGSGGAAGIFAILTAFAASACCIGPAILLALGVGGLGFASFLEPYRPWFLGLTAVFLAAAFWFAYRPLQQEACTDGSCAPANRRRMRATVWIASVVVVMAGSYPYWAGAKAAAPIEQEGLRTVLLDIDGMTCGECASHIKAELEKVPGVGGVSVRYPQADARIELESAETPDQALIEAVERAGYSATASAGSETAGNDPSGEAR